MYLACPNCQKTYWRQHEYQDRCWDCLNVNVNTLKRLQARPAAPSKGRRRPGRKRKRTKKHKHSVYWQRPKGRPADVKHPDGTKIWYLGPNRVRTLGKDYAEVQSA